ncbi:Abi family protein, partial [Listeria monocytogenes]|nr:Abi family protein [Listeria monocytogenes]
MTKGKSTDSLMRHIRYSHEIEISGSVAKQQLLNMGYYHGYKAALYVKNRKNIQPFKDFKEVKAVYDFDLDTKAVFYPMLVKIETSIKNRLIDFLVTKDQHDIEYIYKNKLKDYSSKPTGNKDYQKNLKKNLELRKKIDETIAYNYGKGHPAIQHFFHSNKPIPLWAYFEVITFGELGNFISCMDKDLRINFTESMNLHHTGMNQNGRMIENTIFCLTGLRNATMHNSMIFDCRFSHSNFSSQLKNYVEYSTDIGNITFDTLTDFLILLVLVLKRLKLTKTDLKKYVREYDDTRETLYQSIPFSAYT